MGSYILSTANRFYCGVETTFGQACAVGADDRLIASRVEAMQVTATPARRDKSGSRTRRPAETVGRRANGFTVSTYLTSSGSTGSPSFGPLLQSALGGAPQATGGQVVAAANGVMLQTVDVHGLSIGSAIAYGADIRFVTAVVDAKTVALNAPFTRLPAMGAALRTSVTYGLSTQLPSVSIYDYWDPAGAVNRILTGAVVDHAEFVVNGGTHEFTFSGFAGNLVDSATFAAGQAGLGEFPAEPARGTFHYSCVPASMGQVWLGSQLAQFFTLLDVKLRVQNQLAVRGAEFGSGLALAYVPGQRHVTVEFSLMARTDDQTTALYTLARRREPMSALLQIGQQAGQAMAIQLPCVMPEFPATDDSGQRLIWRFKSSRAEGTAEDELSMAFA